MKTAVLLTVVALLAVPLALMPPSAMGDDDHVISPMAISDRYVPRPDGIERNMTFFYGPFTVPPGQDLNRITVDVPVHDGFLTAVQANVYDAVTGETPSNQDMHIHHAHWFRTSQDPDDEYYSANLAWVFGTGEERTKGDINQRTDAEPGGPSYGIFIEQGQPQALIYMLHNKEAETKNVYVVLEVSFVYGDAAGIQAATGCDATFMDEDDRCRAGEDFHHLYGKLWGTTFDVPRDFQDPESIYVHPRDIPADAPERRATDDLGRFWTVSSDGLAIGSAGHLHPNGERVVVANLGPEGSGCEADLDGDGYPGVSLFYSDKLEMVEGATASEEYQMGVTKPAWRAPVREGDRITQFGVYLNGEYASYEAMSYTGFYMDRLQDPGTFDTSLCTTDPATAAQEMGPYLLGDATGDPLETILNHEYHDHSHGHCGVGDWPACDEPLGELQEGEFTEAIHIAGFLFFPGDQSLSGPAGTVPRVAHGHPLTIVNEDVTAGIRHTLTTCKWPCNGDYVANYPQPDGVLDTGKLGNLDYIDGGLVQADSTSPAGYGVSQDTVPVIQLETDELEPGYYSYYCRIHPWMRGWFEVV